MIHDRICESEKLNQVSPGAESLWVRILTHVDDNGNYDRDPLVVYATCMRFKNGVSVKDVERWLKELITVRSDDSFGLLTEYVVKGRSYLHVINFRKNQDLRDDKTRTVEYPPHPDNIPEPAYLKTGKGTDVLRPQAVSVPSTDSPATESKRKNNGLEVEVEVEVEVEREIEDEVKCDDETVSETKPEEKDSGDWSEFVRFFRSKAGGTKDFGRFEQNQERYHALCRQYGSPVIDSVVEEWVELKGGKSQTKKSSFACKNFLADVDGLIEDRNENEDKSVGPDMLRPKVQY